jgi:hypothetical protein
MKNVKQVAMFFLLIIQLQVVEILHSSLKNFKIIDIDDPVVGSRIHYYLFSFRQLQFAIMIYGINKSLQTTIK